jgi:hypothetical protein
VQGCFGSGSRIVLLVNLSDAIPVSITTAASLDWMQHLQTLSTARHMSAHSLEQDDSSTIAGNSTSQLHPVACPPRLIHADDSQPTIVEASGSMTGKLSEVAGRLSEASGRMSASSAVLLVPSVLAASHQPQQEALVTEVEQLKARVQDLLVCHCSLSLPVQLCWFAASSSRVICVEAPLQSLGR